LIEVLDWDSNGAHDLIGRCTATLRELQVMKEVALINPKKVGVGFYHNSGMLLVQKIAPLAGQPPTQSGSAVGVSQPTAHH